MNPLNALAKQLEPLFKPLPALPKGAKDWLVSAWPVLAIIFGLLQLYTAWGLWQLGHIVNTIADYSNQYSRLYGMHPYMHSYGNHLGLFFWVGLLILVADAI